MQSALAQGRRRPRRGGLPRDEHVQELPGVEVTPAPVRYYPYGELGAHLLGYMREVDRAELALARGARLPRGRSHRRGRRRAALGELPARPARHAQDACAGVRKPRERARSSRRKYLEEPRRVEPIPGRDISLTIDIELVAAIEKAMRGQLAGAVVVVDVRTGRHPRGARKPSFDPNVVSGGNGVKAVGDGVPALERRSAEADAGQDHLRRVPAGLDLQAVHARWRPWPTACIDPTPRSIVAAATSTASATSAAPACTAA